MDNAWWLWPARIGVAAAFLGLIGVVSNLPQGAPPEHARLQLAWRTVGEQVRICRERSAEELARLREHMRLPQTCQVQTLAYRLKVRLNDRERVSRTVSAVGAKGDRPLFVHEALPLAPGRHGLEIAFQVEPAAVQTRHGLAIESAAEQAALNKAIAEATRFRWTGQIEVQAGQIVLVELDEQGRDFRVSGL